MTNSARRWRIFARIRRAGSHLSIFARVLLLAAAVLAGFTLYRLAQFESPAEQTVARAQQGAEDDTATPTPEATPAIARQAESGTTQGDEQRLSGAAPPVADAGFAQPFTVDDARAFVYTTRMGEDWPLIAARFDVEADFLKGANLELWRLRGEGIRPGDQLSIPGLDADATVEPIVHVVGEDDSWERIAERFSVTHLDLLLDNYSLWAHRGVDLRAGDEIEIRYLPRASNNVGASRGWTDGPPLFAPSSVAAKDRMPSASKAFITPGAYIVQPGDTWESIAEETGIAVEALREVNHELAEQALQPGDVMRISWILQVALMLRRVERSGVRSPAELNSLPDEERAALIERGMTVYREQYCGICHQVSSVGTTGIFGPSHDGMAELAAARLDDPAYGGQATDVYTYLYESIIRPEVYYVEGFALSQHRMPSYQHIPEEDLEALIVFLAVQ